MRERRCRERFRAPGESGPAGFASFGPRSPLLRDSTKEKGHGKGKSKDQKQKPSDGVGATRGRVADAFFGASPVVASALGTAPGATPARPTRTYHGRRSPSLKTGTFYFARNRKFLLCLDTRMRQAWRTVGPLRVRCGGRHRPARVSSPPPRVHPAYAGYGVRNWPRGRRG